MSLTRRFVIFYIILSLIILIWATQHPAKSYGDGGEYYGMTTSIGRHFTPNILPEDIFERDQYFQKNGQTLQEPYAGYFKDLNGRYYSYHFWFYSLVNVPVYWIVKYTGGNLIGTFQITNSLLMILALGWLLFRSRMSTKAKLFFLLGLLLNPIWLYVPWPHPEVFSFSLLYIGLLELIDNRKVSAVFWTGVASFQNPAISIITAYIVIGDLIQERKLNKKILIKGLCSGIVLYPYIWTWLHYRKFSIIAEVSTGKVSLDKTLNLFFDPNMGLAVYLPILFLTLLILILKRNKNAFLWLIILFVIGMVCSVQTNWNSGMMYINRYAVWLSPVLLIAIMSWVENLKRNKFIVYALLYILTTGATTVYCIKMYDGSNYVKFQPLAKIILANFPSLYNPPFEVFAERTAGTENAFSNLPLSVTNEHGIRKILLRDPISNLVGYINGPSTIMNPSFSLSRFSSFKEKEDIFNTSIKASFIEGYYGLEDWGEKGKVRWTSDTSKLFFSAFDTPRIAKLSFKIGSYSMPRRIQVMINGRSINISQKIINGETSILFEDSFEQNNVLEIRSLEKREAAVDAKDPRQLAFYIYDLKVE